MLLSRYTTEEWSTYLSYVRSLDFFDTPDYGYLYRLFVDALDRHGWPCDWIFDWNEKQVRSDMTLSSSHCHLHYVQ